MSRTTGLRATIVIAACWLILMPPIWAYTLAVQFGFEYPQFLRFYLPEIVGALFACVLLPAAWFFKRWSVPGLVLAAIVLPIVQLVVGSPTFGVWACSSALFLLLAFGVHRQSSLAAHAPL